MMAARKARNNLGASAAGPGTVLGVRFQSLRMSSLQ